jgi:hypothetical protein
VTENKLSLEDDMTRYAACSALLLLLLIAAVSVPSAMASPESHLFGSWKATLDNRDLADYEWLKAHMKQHPDDADYAELLALLEVALTSTMTIERGKIEVNAAGKVRTFRYTAKMLPNEPLTFQLTRDDGMMSVAIVKEDYRPGVIEVKINGMKALYFKR